MTLADMRLRVRKYADDVAQKKWDVDGANTDVDGALSTAIAEAFAIVASSGSGRFRTTGTFTASSAGVVDLSTVKPVRIYAVRLASGAAPFQAFLDVDPVRATGYGYPHAAAETLQITYIPGVIFPSGAGVSTTWGVAGVDVPELDQLACAIAASQLKADEGEDNPALERRKGELRQAVERMPDVTSWSTGTGPERSCFGRPRIFYTSSGPHTLQLVER